jgi:predicted phage baseplate assembly protein
LTSIVLGNVTLADHGRTIAGERIDPPAGHLRHRPLLGEKNITYQQPHRAAKPTPLSAASTILQDSRKALPAVQLRGDGEIWQPQRDLLNSDRFATEFVVEMDSQGRGQLRFGDGIYGREPATTELQASYRIGSGPAGNVGADAISHVVADLEGITAIRNPLPAQGGVDPESLEEVRHYAPQAFRTQERAVTAADYAAVAERHPQVQKAMATRRWTGSWHTMFITVDRREGRPVDAAFEQLLRNHMERFRLAGHDIEIDAPLFVPLDIILTVCVSPGYFQSDVKQVLLEVLSNRRLPDGRLGYFHPDNFTFGQPVYLSKIIATVMDVPGVQWVDVDDSGGKANRFRRWGRKANGEIKAGLIEMDRLEIARLDNDPSLRENGRLEFIMEGGL